MKSCSESKTFRWLDFMDRILGWWPAINESMTTSQFRYTTFPEHLCKNVLNSAVYTLVRELSCDTGQASGIHWYSLLLQRLVVWEMTSQHFLGESPIRSKEHYLKKRMRYQVSTRVKVSQVKLVPCSGKAIHDWMVHKLKLKIFKVNKVPWL